MSASLSSCGRFDVTRPRETHTFLYMYVYSCEGSHARKTKNRNMGQWLFKGNTSNHQFVSIANKFFNSRRAHSHNNSTFPRGKKRVGSSRPVNCYREPLQTVLSPNFVIPLLFLSTFRVFRPDVGAAIYGVNVRRASDWSFVSVSAVLSIFCHLLCVTVRERTPKAKELHNELGQKRKDKK